MSEVLIAGRPVGDGHPCFIVAEIGINHNGSISIAKKLIELAASTGCDAVKFQKRTVDVVYTPAELALTREHPFGTTNGDLKRHLEFGVREYVAINVYCKESGILWFASPWDEESADFLEAFEVPCYKVASASLTDDSLLRRIRSKGQPIILSTGMSTMAEVGHAVEVVGQENLILLHAVSMYPAEDADLNLLAIRTLKEKFPGVPVGYSGHERGVHPSVAAVVLGACMVERHITLDFAMFGSDQAASLQPEGLRRLVRDIRSVESAMGNGVKELHHKEIPIKRKLRRVGQTENVL